MVYEEDVSLLDEVDGYRIMVTSTKKDLVSFGYRSI